MTPTTFTRLIGLALLVFGGVILYLATGMPQRVTGAAIMAVSLSLVVPAQLQTGFSILIGAGRSAGLIKTKPSHHKKLGETVSAKLEELDIPKKQGKKP